MKIASKKKVMNLSTNQTILSKKADHKLYQSKNNNQLILCQNLSLKKRKQKKIFTGNYQHLHAKKHSKNFFKKIKKTKKNKYLVQS